MPEEEPESQPAPQTPTPNLEELARKIFELLLRELLLENERTGR